MSQTGFVSCSRPTPGGVAAWALGTFGCWPWPNQLSAGLWAVQEPTPEKAQPVEQQFRDPALWQASSGLQWQKPKWERSQEGGLGPSWSVGTELLPLRSGCFPRDWTPRKEQGLSLHRARDLGSLLNGSQIHRQKSMCKCVCACVSVWLCVSPCVHVSMWAYCLLLRLCVCPYACYVSESVCICGCVSVWLCLRECLGVYRCICVCIGGLLSGRVGVTGQRGAGGQQLS